MHISQDLQLLMVNVITVSVEAVKSEIWPKKMQTSCFHFHFYRAVLHIWQSKLLVDLVRRAFLQRNLLHFYTKQLPKSVLIRLSCLKIHKCQLVLLRYKTSRKILQPVHNINIRTFIKKESIEVKIYNCTKEKENINYLQVLL